MDLYQLLKNKLKKYIVQISKKIKIEFFLNYAYIESYQKSK